MKPARHFLPPCGGGLRWGVTAVVICCLIPVMSAWAQEPLEQIRAELGRGNYDGAAKIADRLLTENPKDVDVMVVYGFGMLWKKDYDKSEKLFNRVLELAPTYGDAAIGLIKNYTWSGRMDKLRQFIAANGDRFKKTAYTRLDVLTAELRIEQLDHPDDFTPRAIELAQAILKDDPKNKPAQSVLRGAASPAVSKILRDAERAIAAQRLGDAERHYAKAVELDPANDDVRLGYARVLSWNRKFDDALKIIGQIMDRSPRNTDAMNVQARIFSWTGKLGQADGAYKKILDIQPSNVEAKQGLADVLRWQGKLEEALKLSATLIAAAPDDEGIATGHARLLGQMGKHKEAVGFLEAFLAKHPDAAQARGALSNEYAATKRLTDAVNELRKNIQLDENNKNNYLALGKLYSWQDKTDEAVVIYQAVLDRDPENVAALVGLGNTYRYAGLNAKAMGYYQRALSIDPESTDAQDALRIIQEASMSQVRFKYSMFKYDDVEPPNQSVRTKGYTEERIVDYKYYFTPDNSVLLKASVANLIEKDKRTGDRNYDLDRESLALRWNRQWNQKISTVMNGALHEYEQDRPAFSPLRNKRRRGDFYGILQKREGSTQSTFLVSSDDYITSQTTGILKIGNITTFDFTHQREVAPGFTFLTELTKDRFSVTRVTRDTYKGSLTYKFASIEGAGIEAAYRHVSSPTNHLETLRAFWAHYYSEAKNYIYAHYKYEHDNYNRDAYHEGDLLYSGPVKGNAEYTAELRYTDYFSGDKSWFGTAYLTFKY